MALQKIKELDSGITGNYWVAEVHTNKRLNKTSVMMFLFKDKTSRDAGKQPMTAINAGQMDKTYPTGDEVYEFVKQDAWFSDAVDC